MSPFDLVSCLLYQLDVRFLDPSMQAEDVNSKVRRVSVRKVGYPCVAL